MNFFLNIIIHARVNNILAKKLEVEYLSNIVKEICEEKSERIMLHDIRNYLFVISGFMNLGDYQAAQDKMCELLEDISNMEARSTENCIVDSMVKTKATIAKKFGIKVNYKNVEIPDENKIKIFELCLVLGNIIDNAIEACMRLKGEREKYINLVCKYDGSSVYIEAENPIDERIEIVNNRIETSKEDKENHGYGLRTINNIVNKRNGKLLINQTADTFCISVFMEV